jgi:excisionase family DNA binding protein
MVQGYYTLEEAADYLGLSQEELKQKARSKELRSFQDRGTLHFRIQDIQELARQRGLSSDPELTLGEASLPPAAGPVTPRIATKDAPDVFDFEFDAEAADTGSALFGGKKGPKSGAKAAGSDSDVRLVGEGEGASFSLADERAKQGLGRPPASDVKPPSSASRRAKGQPPSSAVRPPSSAVKTGSGAKQPPSSSVGAGRGGPLTPSKSPKPGSGPQPADSGVRLVPMDSDSDVRIMGTSNDEIDLGPPAPSASSDSNVRLDLLPPPADAAEPMMLTEEINLDEELKKQEEAMKLQAKQPTRVKPKSELKLPAGSPFELSEAELDLPKPLRQQAPPQRVTDDSSSDYDLVPADDGSVLEGGSSEDDFSLELGDDNQVVGLDSDERSLTGPSSGIQLNRPTDKGISLEDGSDSLDDDLSLEVGATPRPGHQMADSSNEFELNIDGPAAEDTATSEFELINLDDAAPRGMPTADTQNLSSSEFELSLDAGEGGTILESDSEFELSLDSGEGNVGESDSEFELTLDDSGNVSSEGEAPQVKASGEEFESDFDMPDLGGSAEESADAELESSDFDLALDDSELGGEEESGSQVVALDEEEVAAESGEIEETGDVVVEEEAPEGEVEVEGEAEVEEEPEADEAVRTVVREGYAKPAPWGALPVVFMLPCVVVMVLVGVMGFELVQSGNGYKAPGVLTKALGDLIGQKIK